MAKSKPIKRSSFWLTSVVGLLVGILLMVLIYVGWIAHSIGQRLLAIQDQIGSRYYAQWPSIKVGQTFGEKELREFLMAQSYRQAESPLDAGEFEWKKDEVRSLMVIYRPALEVDGFSYQPKQYRISLEPAQPGLRVQSITEVPSGLELGEFECLPQKLAVSIAGRVRLQEPVRLSEVPTDLRHAVMAIEDANFLEHPGVSLRSTLRALWKDLRTGRFAEGGSTITQQLMKNLFFSHEKSVIRKIKEALYAILTEWRHSKEAILEAYLNEVYLGQWTTHEIHGVAEASLFYFNRRLEELSLSELAVLAAMIQAPAKFDPFRFPQRVIPRRDLVLKKMVRAGFIETDEYERAVATPLRLSSTDQSEDIRYFLDAIPEISTFRESGTSHQVIRLTVNPYLQRTGAKQLREHLSLLVNSYPKLQKLEKSGLRVQAALLAIDVKRCTVTSLVGGRGYRQTQFNRILYANRQPGSLFKPLVILSALEDPATRVTPMTLLRDEPFEWKYDAQSWIPRNYDKEFRGDLTVRQVLEHSVNIPVARLAEQIGLEKILDLFQRLGLTKNLPRFPSVSLGSTEVTPWELASVYLNLANLGKRCQLSAVDYVTDEAGNVIWRHDPSFEENLRPQPVFQLVNMMKGVLSRGTGLLARNLLRESSTHFAGKTGTTNEYKDAWFVGFSPELLVLTWVGFDEKEAAGLTGAQAALPLWINFVKTASRFTDGDDFEPPPGLEELSVDPRSGGLATPYCPDKEKDYFLPGTAPVQMCPVHSR